MKTYYYINKKNLNFKKNCNYQIKSVSYITFGKDFGHKIESNFPTRLNTLGKDFVPTDYNQGQETCFSWFGYNLQCLKDYISVAIQEQMAGSYGCKYPFYCQIIENNISDKIVKKEESIIQVKNLVNANLNQEDPEILDSFNTELCRTFENITNIDFEIISTATPCQIINFNDSVLNNVNSLLNNNLIYETNALLNTNSYKIYEQTFNSYIFNVSEYADQCLTAYSVESLSYLTCIEKPTYTLLFEYLKMMG